MKTERERQTNSVLLSAVVYVLATAASMIALSASSFAEESRIYVFKEPDGTVHFTNRTPPSGVDAQIFTARGGNFGMYRGTWRSTPVNISIYNSIIGEAAREHSLDPELIKAVIHVESGFNPRAVSRKGARGLMQLMPSTARELGVANPFLPASNIRGGASYLARLLRKFEGNVEYALAAYNAGEGAVQRFNGIPPYNETRQYVKRVLTMKNKYSAISDG